MTKPLDHSKCMFSTGICGRITAGQGKLSGNGYWEHPCPECAIKANLNDATSDQIDEATAEAENYMKYGGGNQLYSSAKSTAMSAIVQYILYTQGLKVNRNG